MSSDTNFGTGYYLSSVGGDWKLWQDSEGGPLKFVWKMKTWGGGDPESHQKLPGGSLRWSNIQRGDRLNFTSFSPKSCPPPPPPPGKGGGGLCLQFSVKNRKKSGAEKSLFKFWLTITKPISRRRLTIEVPALCGLIILFHAPLVS